MKLDVLLKCALALMVAALLVAVTLLFTSEGSPARAQGGGGSSSGSWMMVSSSLRNGEGLLYMFNTQKEVLLVYAYHRGRKSGTGRGRNNFDGDFQFLAGRHCKWDLLYAQLLPYPTESPKSGMRTPAQMKTLFERVSRDGG